MFPMTRSVCGRLLTVVFMLLVSGAASAQPFQWWKMESVKNELGLAADQSAAIEKIFQEGIAQLRQQKDDLDRQENNLSGMISVMADEAQVIRQIDRVESVRGSMNKVRTLMLLHMRQVLTADQRVTLNAIHDRWEKERNRDRQRAAPGGNDGDKRPDGPRRRSN